MKSVLNYRIIDVAIFRKAKKPKSSMFNILRESSILV